jgi:hypothetical protein
MTIKLKPMTEFIILIALILFAAYWANSEVIQTVGPIPLGVQIPTAVDTSYWSNQYVDAFSVAIISFFISLSLGRQFAKIKA